MFSPCHHKCRDRRESRQHRRSRKWPGLRPAKCQAMKPFMKRCAQRTFGGRLASEAVLSNAQRARHARPQADKQKASRGQMEPPKQRTRRPPPAQNGARDHKREARQKKSRKAGVRQHNHIRQNFAGRHANGSNNTDQSTEAKDESKCGKPLQESPGRRRALYSQKETGFPLVSKRWWQQAAIRS